VEHELPIQDQFSSGQAYYVAVVNTGGATDIEFSGTAVLPVELISFSAQKFNNSVRLLWETATEVNNYGFEVERKYNEPEAEWETQGFVKGSGNSNSPKFYEFVDKNPPAGSLEYRLKQIDIDGQYEYSETIVHVDNTLAESEQLPEEYSLFQNYPNPFNPSTNIKYGIPEVSNVKLEIFNSIGERVSLLVNSEKQPGYYSVNWNAETLPSGIYLIRLSIEGNVTNEDFVKVKKATLLK
jgi:hypothetical protein